MPDTEKLTNLIQAGRKRLLDIKETALYLGVAQRTIYNGSGRKAKKPFPVKPKRIGKKLLWDVRELDAFIDGLNGLPQ